MTDIILFFVLTLGSILSLAYFLIPIYLLFKVNRLSRRVQELEVRPGRESTQPSARPLPDSYEAYRASGQSIGEQRTASSESGAAHPAVTRAGHEISVHSATASSSQEVSRHSADAATASTSNIKASAPISNSAPPEDAVQPGPAMVSDSTSRPIRKDSEDLTSVPSGRNSNQGSPNAGRPTEAANQNSGLQQGWQKIEQALAENWTGILGTIILVVGVGFLGIYAALKMGPFLRFLMVLGIGGTMFALSFYLGRQIHWRPLAYWLRSGSGAVFLLACLGSAMFPAMQWIQDQNLALFVILMGVAANLALAWWASIQTVASIHTAISILALLILPRSPLLFSIIGGISVFSTFLSYRSRWEFHLLQAVSVFFLANLLYGIHYGAPGETVDPAIRWLGLFFTGTIAGLALLLHYRKNYQGQAFERWPFLSHIVTWATAALGFALYSTGSRYNTIILFILALLVYFNARRCRKKGPIWLYHTDSLMALFIALLAAMTLNRWEWDSLASALVAAFLTLAFSVAASLDRAKVLKVIGVLLLHFIWLSLVALFAAEISSEKVLYQSGILLASLLLPLIYLWFDKSRPADEGLDESVWIPRSTAFSVAGIFAGVFVALLCIALRDVANAEYYLSALGLLLLLGRHGLSLDKLASAGIPALAGLHFLVIYRSWNHGPGIQLFTDAPLLALLLAGIMLSTINVRSNQPLFQSRLFASLLLGHIAVLIYQLSHDYSSLLPGVLWLMSSILLIELDRIKSFASHTWLRGLELARPVWFLGGLLTVLLFLASHLVVHLQSEALIGPFRARLLIQLFAVAVFLYWARFSPIMQKYDSGFLARIPTFFWDLALVFITMAISLELGSHWLPVIWVIMAIALHFTGRLSWIPWRFQVYSVLYFWLSAIHTAFLSSTQSTPSVIWLDQAWLTGLVAVAGQLGYLLIRYVEPERTSSGGQNPGSLDWFSARFGPLDHKLQRKEFSLFYPLFISVALFLFWSFDSALLTLFWMIEVFVVFFVGLRLNQNHFRYVAQSAMVLCLIRLILFDLSQTSIVMRAFVFLGVGGIMILMNVIYRNFRSRSEDDNANGSHSNEVKGEEK